MSINRVKIAESAQKYIRKGQWDKAVREYQRLVEDDPNDVRSLLKVADLFVKCEQRPQALAAYRDVAYYYLRDGIYDKAVAVFNQALRLDDSDPVLHRDLGDAYHRLGRLKEAVRSMHHAQRLYRDLNDAPNQRDVLERMVRIDPEDIEATT